MRIILDSNEYLFYLHKKTKAIEQLHKKHDIFVNRLIVEEVLRNITEEQKKEFYVLLFKQNIHVEKELPPKELVKKYNAWGLKKGDAIIAAFYEKIEAEIIISENRHFLKTNIPNIKVKTLKAFLKKE